MTNTFKLTQYGHIRTRAVTLIVTLFFSIFVLILCEFNFLFLVHLLESAFDANYQRFTSNLYRFSTNDTGMLQVPLAETNKILAKMSTTSSVTTIAIHDHGIDSRTNRVRSNRVEVDRAEKRSSPCWRSNGDRTKQI